MSDPEFHRGRFRAGFVMFLVTGITLLFLALIWDFLKPLLIAAIFTGMLQPVYRRLVILFRGRRTAASIATVALVILLIFGPLTGFLGIIASQAVQISETAIPWVKANVGVESYTEAKGWLLNKAPFLADFLPDRDQILNGVASLAENVGNFLVGSASKLTAGTAAFFLDLFVMLYAMFFFLIDGRKILEKMLYYVPLSHDDELRMLNRFFSITRATIKGTIVIALIQGTLGGIGLQVAGINGAAFWGTIMVILSIIPGIGTALVWVPIVIYLVVTGETMTGVLLGAWCAGVVGTVDNVLRPKLVGRDAEMPDLLILIGTLGGIFMFGAVGFIVGPIICGMFLTAWDIYGTTFREILPPVRSLKAAGNADQVAREKKEREEAETSQGKKPEAE